MAGKRSATSELNHENWNQEDEPEERGTFKKASEDLLKNRVIRTAKRRGIRSEEGSETKSAFAGFSGFTSKPPSTDFSFLNNLTKSDSSPKTNGIDKNDSPAVANIFSNTSKNSSTSIFGAAPATNIFGSSTNLVPNSSTGLMQSEKYCSKLKGLNESVSKWISKKVDENPLISLQPIFKDYEKYLQDIEKEESGGKTTETEKNTPIPTFNFNPSADKNTNVVPDSTSEKPKDNKGDASGNILAFKFGGPTASVSSSAPTFSFGSANSGKTSSFGSTSTASLSNAPTFSFGSHASSEGFSFGAAATKTDKPKETEENNDEDEPPKVDFKPVEETDYVYKVRCKVFVKKGDALTTRGVGNLFLKPIEGSDKVQLIVRADTNLGNLLLNLVLSQSVPVKKSGDKDVMLVTIPTPDEKPPPTPVFIRVKNSDEAEKLFDALEKNKK